MRWQQLSREQEHARLMREYGTASFETTMIALERQFTVLHNRSQLLLTLCGIIITTTGFSGRNIASTLPGQLLIIAGVGLTLAAAVVVVWRVLHLHWLTAQVGEDRSAWLMRSLEYRDHKAAGYRLGLLLVTAGLTFYAAAIAIMLLNPALK
jgi:hypothetical protein